MKVAPTHALQPTVTSGLRLLRVANSRSGIVRFQSEADELRNQAL